MTTPHHAAKRQWLIDRYTEMLAEAGDRGAETRAVRLVEEAENLGWTPPRTVVDDQPPAASYSTREGRERAKRIFAEALAAKRGQVTA